tara:strand:+ start:111 stop:1013 length:903 start_codon:yes stop_codon:yes gene_type:complete
MKLIYAHLDPKLFDFSDELKMSDFVSSPLPEYANLSMDQSEQLGYDVELIENRIGSMDEAWFQAYNKEINEFYELCKRGFPSFYSDPFWLTTFIRLYVVYLYAKSKGVDQFIHMEYDNLVYRGPEYLENLPKGAYFTQLGPQCGSAGFVYVNGLDEYSRVIDRFKELLEKGENVVRQFTQYDHLSEMVMIDLIKQNTNDIQYLPLFPKDDENYKGMVFDGASYGQYLGGIQGEEKEGWHASHHYVGQRIDQGLISEIRMSSNMKPQLWYKSGEVELITPIFNLHIHSKKLERFLINDVTV